MVTLGLKMIPLLGDEHENIDMTMNNINFSIKTT